VPHRGPLLISVVAVVIAAYPVHSQTPDQPTNSAPNPYKTVENWAKMPEGRTWGSTSAVEIGKDGKTIWVAERCGVNSCADSKLDSILAFDATGKLVKSFGGGMLLTPHGIFVDRDGNIWVTDCACTGGAGRGRGRASDPAAVAPAPAAQSAPQPPTEPKGHQVFKFSPDGKLLLTLGKAGGARAPEFFFQPNDVLVAPNGTIFVSEGHSSQPGSTARILKFDKNGAFVKTWGQLGTGPDDFDQPHALAMDSKGRLFIGDRGNNRIVIADQDGKVIDRWTQFSRPSGIYIDKKDNIYVTDSESGSINPPHKAWKRGIRIGKIADGRVTAFIPDPNENATNTSAAEGVAVDAAGNIYGAEVGPKALKRYVKQ
jgi:sugar lactone lactonase YvrE